MASGAHASFVVLVNMPGLLSGLLPFELLHQAHGCAVLVKSEAPEVDTFFRIMQLQGAHPGVVVVLQTQSGLQLPGFPGVAAGFERQQALVAQDQFAATKLQLKVQSTENDAKTFSPTASGIGCEGDESLVKGV